MKFSLPNIDQTIQLAQSLGMSLDRESAAEYRQMMAGIFAAYAQVDEAPDLSPEVRYPRTPGRPPEPAENPHGAWIRRLDIAGKPGGPIEGMSVAVKDSMMVAGVPMSGGTRFLAGYAPEVDAEIVTRLLDAGARVVGKTVCEYLGISGSSHTGYPDVVQNPWRRGYGAGGSSSGSAAAVAAGAADIGLGTDQGGSIRIPAAWCGIVGMKPTYGLVPYTGILPIEATLDHAGALTRTVRDNARVLAVLAGYDALDPRQHPGVPAADYLEGIDGGIDGVRIGLLAQGFGWSISEPAVDGLVRAQAERLAASGAVLEEVDLPVHRDARDYWTPLFVEGFLNLTMKQFGAGTNHRGLFVGSATEAFSRWVDVADELSAPTKVVMLAAQHFSRLYKGSYYGKSQNLMRRVRAAYDEALARHDVLVMPTTPVRAQPLPPRDASDSQIWDAALGMNVNTAPFCSTGHPSISVPCGLIDGLPVGLMLVGRHFEEATLYRVAQACESLFGRLSLPAATPDDNAKQERI